MKRISLALLVVLCAVSTAQAGFRPPSPARMSEIEWQQMSSDEQVSYAWAAGGEYVNSHHCKMEIPAIVSGASDSTLRGFMKAQFMLSHPSWAYVWEGIKGRCKKLPDQPDQTQTAAKIQKPTEVAVPKKAEVTVAPIVQVEAPKATAPKPAQASVVKVFKWPDPPAFTRSHEIPPNQVVQSRWPSPPVEPSPNQVVRSRW